MKRFMHALAILAFAALAAGTSAQAPEKKKITIAVGGKTALSSGTASRTACVNVLEFGPGQGL